MSHLPNSIDQLTVLLAQAHGVVAALECADNGEEEFNLPHGHLMSLVWLLSDLIGRARSSADVLAGVGMAKPRADAEPAP